MRFLLGRGIALAVSLLALAPRPAAAQQASAPAAGCPAPSAIPPLKEENFFPGPKETDLGDVMAEQAQKDFRVIEDEAINSYLNDMAQRILAAFPGERTHIEIRLIDQPYLNAFGIPGGRIYVMRKIVAFVRSEAELAGLLSHEMGHELSHQGAVELSFLFRRVLGVSEVGNRQDIFDKYNRLLENQRRDPKAFEKLAEHEEPDQYQADRIALTAMANAGYDPQAFVDFYDRLAQTKGKTGNWLSDALGTTRPDEKRLRIMKKALAELPPGCRAVPAASAQKFEDWQNAVIAYTGLGRHESLRALEAKKPLSSPLRPELSRLRFSPDGRYLLAQDDASVYVASREPLRALFRIDAPDVAESDFTPDSTGIVFRTHGHRVELWSIEDQERVQLKELTIPGNCLQAGLSPDGKTYACYTPAFKLSLFDVDSGATIVEKEKLFEPVGIGTALFLGVPVWVDLPGIYFTWMHMSFSPDGRYYLASHHEDVFAYDISARKEIHVGAPLRNSLRGGFAFLEGDRVIGQQGDMHADSILGSFPGGEAIARLKLPEYRMEAASHGNYVLLRHLKEAELAILDLDSKQVVLSSPRAMAADAYPGFFVAERASGEVGLYDKDVKLVQRLDLPTGPLPVLRASAVSPDLRWLALSGPRRGAVWDLGHNERVLFLRNFTAAWFEPAGGLFVDFPKQGDVERTIVRANPQAKTMSTVRTIPEDKHATAIGGLRLYRVPNGGGKDIYKNITLEVRHIHDDSLLWSRPFAHEAPIIHVNESADSMVFAWALNSDAAKDELHALPDVAAQSSKIKDRGTALLLVAVKASTGAPAGALAVDTGKLSFNARRAMVLGPRMILGDNRNRTLVYSLATGEQEGKTFGTALDTSLDAKLMAAENEPGELSLYDLESLEKRGELKFSHPIALARFSADGKRLLVLTRNQVAYFFDLPRLVSAPAGPAAQ